MTFCSKYWKAIKNFILIAIFFSIIHYFWYQEVSINLKNTIKFVRSSYSASEKIDVLDLRSEIDILIDNRKRDNLELLNEAQYTLRNFPPQQFLAYGSAPSYNTTCANFPTLYDLKFDGNWQELNTPNGSAFLYGAYLDIRNLTFISRYSRGPVIRILGMIEYSLALDTTTSYICQLWYQNQTKPLFSPVTRKILHRTYRDGKHRFFLFSCNLAKLSLKDIPESVSLVIDPCQNATNNLRVQYENATEKKDFAVCVKGLDFFHEDHSARLVEWIELLRILGADKIFLYNFAEHPNASKVLKYYENTDYVDVTPLTLPGGLPNDPRLRHIYFRGRGLEQIAHEMIPYNDCFYRNMHKYKYLANLDPDETVVPRIDLTWNDLIMRLNAENAEELHNSSAVCFRNAYFFSGWRDEEYWYPGIPKFMHQLQNVHRRKKYSPLLGSTKCFHNSEYILITHNHNPRECFGRCRTMYVDEEIAHLQHYRHSCPRHIPNCLKNFLDKSVLDNNVWRYKDELINRTVGILSNLGFISNGSA